MTASEPTDACANPRGNPASRCFAGAALAAVGMVVVIELIGQLIGSPGGGLLAPIAAAAAGGLVVGFAAAHGIPRFAGRRLTSRAGRSGSVITIDTASSRRPDGPRVAAANGTQAPLELSDPNATGRFDAISAKVVLVAGELGHYKELLDILRDQVANVSVETEAAALDILTRLNEIDRLIQDMIAFLNQAGASDTMADLMDRTEARLAANRRLLDEFRAGRDEAAVESQERLGEVQGMVAELNRVVGQVRTISKQTNMLAFNAAIEAARAGQFGKGFAVVASEVKQLSRDSDKAALDIQDGIMRLQEAISASMETIVHKRLDAERKGFEVITASMAELSENLERITSHQRDVLVQIQKASEMIAHPIMALIGSIQFQDITRQELQHVSNGIEFVASHSGQLRAVLEDFGRDHDLDSTQAAIAELMAHYVMSQQRNIHSAAIGTGGREEKGSLVQLF
jgi:methyl-accepting chemotaxis protein